LVGAKQRIGIKDIAVKPVVDSMLVRGKRKLHFLTGFAGISSGESLTR